jgi:hypothetical protein
MKTLRNFLNIPLRIIKLVALFLAIVFFCIAFFLFFALIDPIRWILTGKYRSPDERGDDIVDLINKILDKIDFNTQNK